MPEEHTDGVNRINWPMFGLGVAVTSIAAITTEIVVGEPITGMSLVVAGAAFANGVQGLKGYLITEVDNGAE